GAGFDAAFRGQLFHDVVAEFAMKVDPLSPEAESQLIALAEQHFAQNGVPRARAIFWAPRFARAAKMLTEWERERRPRLDGAPAIEQSGVLTLTLADGTAFDLSARADRIEKLRGGGLAIIDFKT